MLMLNIPFGTTDWSDVERTEHPGETGKAYWRTRQFGTVRVRMVEYTAGYLADHWCEKGHVIFVISGNLYIEHKDNTNILLEPGTTYVVGDDSMPHRASSKLGAKVYIVD